jgi:hypothetical protein
MIGVYIDAGLCNRIFQMIFAYSFAKKHNTTFCFERWNFMSHHSNQTYNWLIERFTSLSNYHNVEIPVEYNVKYIENIHEGQTYITTIPTNIKDNNLFVYGFFQNEKYFVEYKNDVIELLKEPKHVSDYITTYLSDILPVLKDAYFLHIRLGDYVNHKTHWINLENYYRNSLNQIPDNTPIIVFSNFPEDIKTHYPNINKILVNKQIYSANINDEVVSLYMMARCEKGGICSNSSFSWWASWLNKNENKKVFMPNKWFNTDWDTSDIYPSYATIIPVS